jgi:hypothetical protein
MEITAGYCCGVERTKRPKKMRPFSSLFYVPIRVLIIPDSFTRSLWQKPAETPSGEPERLWREKSVNFAVEVSLSYCARSSCLRTLRRPYFPSEASRPTDFYRL